MSKESKESKESIISPSLQQEIKALQAEFGEASLMKVREEARLLEGLKLFVHRVLAEAHLVLVASTLAGEFGGDLEDLEAVGLPVDILCLFPNWRQGLSSPFQPKGRGLRLTSTGAGQELGPLRLQLSPLSSTIPNALILIRDLLRKTDPSVKLYVVVEPGANLQKLKEAFQKISLTAQDRLRLVEARSITIFAQDNALAGRDEFGKPVLMIPRAFQSGKPRQEDELLPEEAEQGFGQKVVRSRLYWEGGNILHDEHCCLIGSDTIGENMVKLGLSQDEVLTLFEAEFGTKVISLGDMSGFQFDLHQDLPAKSGQASFHLDLDIALLGRFDHKRKPRAIVADPARGLDFLPAVLAQKRLFTRHFLPADQVRELIQAEYEAFAKERYPKLLGYCSRLEELGYLVFGVPDLRIDPKQNIFRAVNLDFGYGNILPGLWRGRPAVYYLPWGIRTLDLGAEKRFREAGVHPVRLSSSSHLANELMMLSGGLHCFCGQI